MYPGSEIPASIHRRKLTSGKSAGQSCEMASFRLTRRCHTPGQPLRTRFYIIAQLPHDLGGLADLRFAESDAQVRCDRKKPDVELAVARVTFGRKPHELRAPVLRIFDEFHKPLGRKLIGEPLHPLTAGGPHLGDLRHGQRTKQRQASHEAERAAAPARDEPRLLADRPYPEEALRYFEHQLGDRLALAVDDRARPCPLVRPGPLSCRRHRLRSPVAVPASPVDISVVKWQRTTL